MCVAVLPGVSLSGEEGSHLHCRNLNGICLLTSVKEREQEIPLLGKTDLGRLSQLPWALEASPGAVPGWGEPLGQPGAFCFSSFFRPLHWVAEPQGRCAGAA